MRIEKSCGAVVYKKANNQFLFLIIKSKAFQFYGFPKGHVEPEETELETAIREVLEETNIKINIIESFKEQIEYSPSYNTKKTVIYFLGEAINHDVKIQVEEVSGYKWLPYDEANQLITFDNEKQVLKSANLYLTKSTT